MNTSGVPTTEQQHWTSEIRGVLPNTTYYIFTQKFGETYNSTGYNNAYACRRVTFFDAEGNFISQGESYSRSPITTPSGCAIMRFSGLYVDKETKFKGDVFVTTRAIDEHTSFLHFTNNIATDSVDKYPETIARVSAIDRHSSFVRLTPKDKLPCVAFIVDDCNNPDVDEQIHNLFFGKGVRCGYAFIAYAERIANKDYARYLDWQKEGFGFMSHSNSAKTLDTTNYTYATALSAVADAKFSMEKFGLVANGFVCPQSSLADEFVPIMGKFHSFMFKRGQTSSNENGRDADIMALTRYNIETRPIDEIKAFVDDCIARDRLLTFVGHPSNFGQGDWSMSKLEHVIDYCIAKRNNGEVFFGEPNECVKYFFDL